MYIYIYIYIYISVLQPLAGRRSADGDPRRNRSRWIEIGGAPTPCVYVCMYECIYIYIYIYTHIHTHTYTHTYIYIYIYTHVYLSLSLSLYMYIYIYIHIIYISDLEKEVAGDRDWWGANQDKLFDTLCLSMCTRSPSQDFRLFGPRPWKILATYEQMGS